MSTAKLIRKTLNNELVRWNNDYKSNFPFIRFGANKNYDLLIEAEIDGPETSVYKGGVFRFTIDCSESYPYERPTVLAQTPIYHPNFNSENGAICLDVLKKNYNPESGLRSLLYTIYKLLLSPDPTDPLIARVGYEYQTNRDVFDRTAREYTAKYATPNQAIPNELDNYRSLRLRREADDLFDAKASLNPKSINDRYLYDWIGFVINHANGVVTHFAVTTTNNYPAEKPTVRFQTENEKPIAITIGSTAIAAGQPVPAGVLQCLDKWTEDSRLEEILKELTEILLK